METKCTYNARNWESNPGPVVHNAGQWSNSQEVECPRHFSPGEFLLTYRRKRGKEKKRKMEKKEGKSKKGRWKIENGRRKSYKMRRGFFFSFLFTFNLFTFQNHWNLFWVYQNGNFVPGKRILRQEKYSGKMTLPPL